MSVITTSDHPASQFAFETFRTNGSLIAAGDALVDPLGLTSARWQVMGAIAEAGGGLCVAGIARNMGLVRQSVQRIANDLVAQGLARFADNPHHRRAKLVQLTEHGTAAYESANARWLSIANALTADIDAQDVNNAIALMRRFRERLQSLIEHGDSR